MRWINQIRRKIRMKKFVKKNGIDKLTQEEKQKLIRELEYFES